MEASSGQAKRISSGVPGLDEVLNGGYVPQRAYLIRGGPGTGKTTLGMHFLTSRKADKSKSLYINLSETAEQIRANAAAIGCDLAGVTFVDLTPSADFFTEVQTYDVFSPAEVEREPTTNRIISEIRALRPERVFLDVMSHLRYLASDTFQFRRQVLSFLRFLVEQGATVVFTSESSDAEPDDDLQYMADGIVELSNDLNRRILKVTKFRGSGFREGRHTMRLGPHGMEVFPRILPGVSRSQFANVVVPSGVAAMDALLFGGLERDTITIISGPTGVGKTTLGLQFMKEAAQRGERSVIYSFEEAIGTLLARSEAVKIPVNEMMRRGTLEIVAVEPLFYSADEFARRVQKDVEAHGTRIVMFDSVAGYRLSLRGEDMVPHLHALCKYLQSIGVTVILLNEVEEITGNFRITELGISYIADNIIFLRYLEIEGQMRRAIGVLKKRMSDFERTLREYQITSNGIVIGEPLTNLRGILSGIPTWEDGLDGQQK